LISCLKMTNSAVSKHKAVTSYQLRERTLEGNVDLIEIQPISIQTNRNTNVEWSKVADTGFGPYFWIEFESI
jgi:hypothetical protein